MCLICNIYILRRWWQRCVVYLSSYYINYYTHFSQLPKHTIIYRHDSSIYGVSQETLIVENGSTKTLSTAELRDFNTSRELRIRARPRLPVLLTPSSWDKLLNTSLTRVVRDIRSMLITPRIMRCRHKKKILIILSTCHLSKRLVMSRRMRIPPKITTLFHRYYH